MANEIISYYEMCQREGTSLQRGMNYDFGKGHSVILMSVRQNAPYRDRFEGDGSTLIYEGHDVPRSPETHDPKKFNQQAHTYSGKPTQNGFFFRAAEEYKSGKRSPQRVRVYEKLKSGIWSYNGVFHLVDAWKENDSQRCVFKFKLVAIESDEDFNKPPMLNPQRRRIIPTHVKLEVWKRDNGRCVMCGATDELHFDHILPFSKGGTSLTSENVQLLCARHNLEKHNRIL